MCYANQSDRYRQVVQSTADRVIANTISGEGFNWRDVLDVEEHDRFQRFADAFGLSIAEPELAELILGSGNVKAVEELRSLLSFPEIFDTEIACPNCYVSLHIILYDTLKADLSLELLRRGFIPESYSDFLHQCERKQTMSAEDRRNLYNRIVIHKEVFTKEKCGAV